MENKQKKPLFCKYRLEIHGEYVIILLGEVIDVIEINNICYELVDERSDGFNEEAFRARYSEILNKYDYILGDWGYGQLRLKGFFDDQNQKAAFDTKISTVSEYLYEFCNFGCPYFVVKKIKK